MRQTEIPDRTALIIGCGIAGPTLAMFLQRAGFTPIVYEQLPEPRDDAGFFLNLAPNGLAVLDTLGIRDEVAAEGTDTQRIIFLNHRGKKLGENTEPSLLIRRGRLTHALRMAAIARGVRIEYGKQLKAIDVTTERSAIARFTDGSEARGELLAGCDGIHSRTRQSIMPEAPQPEYLGVIDSGGFSQNSSIAEPDGVFRMTFGTEGFFGYQATPSGKIYWFENFAQKSPPAEEQLDAISDHVWRSTLLDIHDADHAPIASIIRLTEGEVGKWPNYGLPSLPSWHNGRVCLLGDAAHAMSPSAGQGASMAIEDAMVLAKCLRDMPNVEQAFASFEAMRRDRVEKIAAAARRNSDQKGPTNAVTRSIRDLVLPIFLRMGVKSAQETSSYRVEWGEDVQRSDVHAVG